MFERLSPKHRRIWEIDGPAVVEVLVMRQINRCAACSFIYRVHVLHADNFTRLNQLGRRSGTFRSQHIDATDLFQLLVT